MLHEGVGEVTAVRHKHRIASPFGWAHKGELVIRSLLPGFCLGAMARLPLAHSSGVSWRRGIVPQTKTKRMSQEQTTS